MASCKIRNSTADIARVKIEGDWYPMAKVGRQACDNPELLPVGRLP